LAFANASSAVGNFCVFLMKTMQQHEISPITHKEDHPSDAPTGQSRPDLVEAATQRSHQRHAERPAKLDSPDVVANCLAIRDRKRLKPITDCLATGGSSKEDRGHFL
jgi:hypothetical protein